MQSKSATHLWKALGSGALSCNKRARGYTTKQPFEIYQTEDELSSTELIMLATSSGAFSCPHWKTMEAVSHSSIPSETYIINHK